MGSVMQLHMQSTYADSISMLFIFPKFTPQKPNHYMLTDDKLISRALAEEDSESSCLRGEDGEENHLEHHLQEPEILSVIWRRALDKCTSDSLKDSLLKEGKLSSIYFCRGNVFCSFVNIYKCTTLLENCTCYVCGLVDLPCLPIDKNERKLLLSISHEIQNFYAGHAIAEIELCKSNDSKPEAFFEPINTSLQSVLGCNVEIRTRVPKTSTNKAEFTNSTIKEAPTKNPKNQNIRSRQKYGEIVSEVQHTKRKMRCFVHIKSCFKCFSLCKRDRGSNLSGDGDI
jgi:hypothetical protein